jgi:hypothetical protein
LPRGVECGTGLNGDTEAEATTDAERAIGSTRLIDDAPVLKAELRAKATLGEVRARAG